MRVYPAQDPSQKDCSTCPVSRKMETSLSDEERFAGTGRFEPIEPASSRTGRRSLSPQRTRRRPCTFWLRTRDRIQWEKRMQTSSKYVARQPQAAELDRSTANSGSNPRRTVRCFHFKIQCLKLLSFQRTCASHTLKQASLLTRGRNRACVKRKSLRKRG